MFGVQDQDQDAQSNEWNKPPRRGRKVVKESGSEPVEHAATQEPIELVLTQPAVEPEPEGVPDEKLEDWYAERVNAGRRLTVEGLIITGRWLNWSKVRLGHGRWLRVLERTRMDKRTAQKLMKVAKSSLVNASTLTHLPSSLTSLDLLADLPNAVELVTDGTIHEGLTVQEAKRLVRAQGEYGNNRHPEEEPEQELQRLYPAPFTLVVWNQLSITEDAPVQFYDERIYPNIVVVHVMPVGFRFCETLDGKTPLVIVTDENERLISGKLNLLAAFRLCSLTDRGIPNHEPMPNLFWNLDDLVDRLKLTWPEARRAWVGLNTPEGWDDVSSD